MKKMKKLLALLLVLCMVFSVATLFAGCDDSSKKKSSSSKQDEDDKDDDEKEDNENGENQNDNGEQNAPMGDDLDGAKQAFANYVNTAFYADVEAAKKVAPSEFWDRSTISLEVVLENLAPAMESYFDSYYSGVGNMVNVDNKITSHEQVTAKQLADCKQSLQNLYGMNPDLIDSAYIFSIEMLLTGDVDSYTETGTMLAVRYDGNWYPFFGVYYESGAFNCQNCVSAGGFLTQNVGEYLSYQIPGVQFEPDIPAQTDITEALYCYVDLMYGGATEKLYATAPQEFWDSLEWDYTPEELKTALLYYHQEFLEANERELGEGFGYYATVTDAVEYSDSDTQKLYAALVDNYGLNPDLFGGIMELTFDLEVWGANDQTRIEDNFYYMLCYDGYWYVIDAGFYMSGTAYAQFMAVHLVAGLPQYMG